MSQFNLTTEEDLIVLDALRSKANQYTTMFGSADTALDALVVKIEGQLLQPKVVEPAPVATPVVEPEAVVETPEEAVEEAPRKAKKAK